MKFEEIDYKTWIMIAISFALIIFLFIQIFNQTINIKCEVLDPTINTCFCGEQIDENNFKNMEIGYLRFYEEGIYCQLKEMEIKLDE